MTKKKKTAKEKPPEFIFQWATFCKRILEEPGKNERTLVDILAGLRLQIGILQTGDVSEGQDNVTIDLGDLGAFARFKVEPTTATEHLIDGKFKIQFPDREIEKDCVFKAAPDNSFYQHSHRLRNFMFVVPVKEGRQVHNIRLSWHIKNEDLGFIDLPVTIDMQVQKP